jgi:hypothetical protein
MRSALSRDFGSASSAYPWATTTLKRAALALERVFPAHWNHRVKTGLVFHYGGGGSSAHLAGLRRRRVVIKVARSPQAAAQCAGAPPARSLPRTPPVKIAPGRLPPPLPLHGIALQDTDRNDVGHRAAINQLNR